MFKNLKAEMIRKGINAKKIAEKLKISESAIFSKLAGKTEFTLREAFEIHNEIFPEIPLNILFEKDTPQQKGA